MDRLFALDWSGDLGGTAGSPGLARRSKKAWLRICCVAPRVSCLYLYMNLPVMCMCTPQFNKAAFRGSRYVIAIV